MINNNFKSSSLEFHVLNFKTNTFLIFFNLLLMDDFIPDNEIISKILFFISCRKKNAGYVYVSAFQKPIFNKFFKLIYEAKY